MIKEKRYFVYLILLILAPEVALANIAIPMLFFTWPGMFVMFVAVIIVEEIVLKKRWPSVNEQSLQKANRYSYLFVLIVITILFIAYYLWLFLVHYN